jgi:cellulose synthase/poly-beta-1,6-N-acetylglucosamine synthase-like glycosyltransferase
MIQYEPHSADAPRFSIVIPVYNDWGPLDRCLGSLAQQTSPPSFEVIVVDDGSTEDVPESVRRWESSYALAVIRQAHAGIPAARNLGVRNAKANILLFADADCRLEPNCLAALDAAVSRAPQHDYFQLRLAGDRESVIGRAEHLRLTTFQNFMLRPDGRIGCLNTAGFAIRRARVQGNGDLFDPAAFRGEDTLLMASLMQTGQGPLFVPEAVVEHTVDLSLMGCLRKDIRTAYLEARAYDVIASKGVKIRLTQRERLRLLRSMWKAAAEDSLGRSAWFVVVFRQGVQRIASFAYRYLRVRTKKRQINSSAPLPMENRNNRQ